MNWIPDSTLEHLRRVAELPSLPDGKYRVVEELARGGMGTVFVAEDEELGRRVALKVLSDPLADPEAAARMVREARILARLEHPGIVPVHDVGQLEDGRVFYVMKLVQGARLDRHFGPDATPAERLRVFERVCEPVSFAHAHGVIHRDLKPANIMVGPFGEVLVMDWGVAKLLQGSGIDPDERPAGSSPQAPSSQASSGGSSLGAEDPANASTVTRHTAHGTIIGTPAYMSPEQARGDVDRIDERSDVYALGAILFFLLTGQEPSTGDGARTPRKIDGAIARPLEAICLKALDPSPASRYASVDQLRAEIARFQGGLAVEAYPEGVLEKAARFAANYRTPILLVLAYLVMRLALLAM